MSEILNDQNSEQSSTNDSQEPGLEPAAPRLSTGERLIKIFTDPVAVFQDLRNHPTWILPLILIILMTVVFTVATKDQMLEYRKQMIYDSTKMTEEMKDRAIEQIENMSPSAYYIQSVVGSVIGIALIYSITAGVLLLVGNFFLGGHASFKQIFSLYLWTNMVSLIEMPVKMILILQKNTAEVYTSLALLLDPAQSKTFLFQLLNAIDIFAIWKVILLAIGFSIVYRFSAKKSYITIVSLYIIYVLISIGFGRLFI